MKDLTLNSKVLCLHRPMDRLPIGTTIDSKQSFRLSLHSFQMEMKSSSPLLAGPLMIAIKM